MKSLKKTLKSKIFPTILVLIICACSKNDSVEQEAKSKDYLEVALSSEIDVASAFIDDIVIRVYESQEQTETGSINNEFDSNERTSNDFSDCVTITVIIQALSREITIDFGNEGCVINGNTLKGKIILSYERIPGNQQVTITKALEDFYFNNKNIIGVKTFVKVMSNDNGNPEFTKTTDITVIWPNGLQASRNGIKVREWIEGFGNNIWSDNVFQVTGNWISTFVDGNSHSYEVLIPLRREAVCRYFISGSLDVERSNFSGIFDYGDGSCDNLATFTFDDGTVMDIILN